MTRPIYTPAERAWLHDAARQLLNSLDMGESDSYLEGNLSYLVRVLNQIAKPKEVPND